MLSEREKNRRTRAKEEKSYCYVVFFFVRFVFANDEKNSIKTHFFHTIYGSKL